MITYNNAISNILSSAKTINAEMVDFDNALGRVCSQTILSREALPSVTTSSMDGFAVKAEVTQHCSKESPLHLPVMNTIAAGDKPIQKIHHAHTCAYEIMTGAPIPDEYNSVIPIELIKFTHEKSQTFSHIIIQEPTSPGCNIRYIGEDFQIDDIVLSPGTVIEPPHILALASLGLFKLSVFRQPKIVILSTGNELVPVETFPLAAGQVRHSNGIYLTHALKHFGMNADFLGSFPDDIDLLEARLHALLNTDFPPDIIITTGAVSAGKWDFIPTLSQRLNADILFHKVAIRPGKPLLAAKLSEKTYLFGLPGNPISCAVGLRFFIYPLLRKLQGMQSEKPKLANLKHAVPKSQGLQMFCKANYEVNSKGLLTVEISSKGQESFKIKPLLNSNCWAVLLDSRGDYQAGDLIDVYPF